MEFKAGKRVTISIEGEETKGRIVFKVDAGTKPVEAIKAKIPELLNRVTLCFEDNAYDVDSYLIVVAKKKNEKNLFRMKAEEMEGIKVIIRQYGLLDPINWDDDCCDQLFMSNQLWNRLVEIEQQYQTKYRAVISSDSSVAEIEAKIEANKQRIIELDGQRKQARMENRGKKGTFTEPFDTEIKNIKELNKELSAKAKEARKTARDRLKSLTKPLDEEREKAVVGSPQGFLLMRSGA